MGGAPFASPMTPENDGWCICGAVMCVGMAVRAGGTPGCTELGCDTSPAPTLMASGGAIPIPWGGKYLGPVYATDGGEGPGVGDPA